MLAETLAGEPPNCGIRTLEMAFECEWSKRLYVELDTNNVHNARNVHRTLVLTQMIEESILIRRHLIIVIDKAQTSIGNLIYENPDSYLSDFQLGAQSVLSSV